jgi:ABC-type glycerol-3-phosphate transport system substrate-binding protein
VSAASIAAAAGVSGCIGGGEDGGGGGGAVDILDDSDSTVDGSSIMLAMDEGHNTRPFEWFNDAVQENTGVEVGEINGFRSLFSKFKTEFTNNSRAFDLVRFYPQYLGIFAANDHLTPLDDMMEIYGWDPQFDDLLKPFRQMYTQWGGNTYALPIDGDVLMLVYQRDLFEKHDVDVPEAWAEFNEVARYFTEETDDVDHGVVTYGKRDFSYGWFLARFGGLGGSTSTRT